MLALRSYPVARMGHWSLGRPAHLHGARPIRLAQGPAPQGIPPQADPSQQLRETGAVATVQISLPSAYQAAGGKGNPQTITAMIDTGASISGISIEIAAAAGLQEVGSADIGGVGGISHSPIYAAAIAIPQYNVTVDPIQIAGISAPLPNINMLIGRDILSHLNLDYHGLQGVFSLVQDTPASGAPTPGAPAPPPAPGQPSPKAPVAALPQPPAGQFPTTPVLVGGGLALLTAAGFIFKIF